MSAWKELPRPATPGPWFWPHDNALAGAEPNRDPDGEWLLVGRFATGVLPLALDAAAIAALPEYVAEVERLRAVIDWAEEDGRLPHGLLSLLHQGATIADVLDGEWPA